MAVLANYPIEIMRAVCDPVKGLPAQIKWLPTIAEVVDACRNLQDYDLRQAHRQRRIEQQLSDRQSAPRPRYSGQTISYQAAEEILAAKPGTRILGVFDHNRTVPYRG